MDLFQRADVWLLMNAADLGILGLSSTQQVDSSLLSPAIPPSLTSLYKHLGLYPFLCMCTRCEVEKEPLALGYDPSTLLVSALVSSTIPLPAVSLFPVLSTANRALISHKLGAYQCSKVQF